MANGGYSDTPYYFDTLQNPTNGSLAGTASGLNGVFAYSSGSIFPNNVSTSGDNYWVDVVFHDTSTGPQATDKNGFVTTENATLSIASVSNASNGTVTYNASTQTVSFVPNSGYVGPANFTYTVTDGQNTGSGNVSLTVNYPVTAQSLFNPSNTPASEANDPNSAELGVQFRTSVNGTITGIRFYKSPLDTGTHTA